MTVGPTMPMPTVSIEWPTPRRLSSSFQMICSIGPRPRPPKASGQVSAPQPWAASVFCQATCCSKTFSWSSPDV